MLRIATIESVRSLILVRPEAGNALNLELVDALQCAVDDAGADQSIRALIIVGDGPKFFCTGGDVKEFAGISNEAALFEMVGKMGRLFLSIGRLRIPVIAAVNGYALGAGAELAVACDIRVVGSEARIGFTQAGVGVLPTLYSLRRLRALCGQGAASELILSAATMNASEAAARGLTTTVVPSGTEQEAALDLGRKLAANCPLAMSAAKALLSHEVSTSMQLESETRRIFPQLWFSPFHRAAERRFADRSQAGTNR